MIITSASMERLPWTGMPSHYRERKQWAVESQNIKAAIVDDTFDWQNDAPLCIPFEDTILYRLHVRGFTKHVSSKVSIKELI